MKQLECTVTVRVSSRQVVTGPGASRATVTPLGWAAGESSLGLRVSLSPASAYGQGPAAKATAAPRVRGH